MEELTLGDRVTLLERELEFTREFTALMLAFMAHKTTLPLREFAEWRSWVEAINAHRDEAFALGFSFIEIEEKAGALLEQHAQLLSRR